MPRSAAIRADSSRRRATCGCSWVSRSSTSRSGTGGSWFPPMASGPAANGPSKTTTWLWFASGSTPAIAGYLPFAAGPDAIGGNQEPPMPLRLVLLRDTHEHPQVARRREESARIAAERGIEVTELAAAGDQPLERLASLVQLIDYASVYLAIANGIDPAPIAAIEELKARIA